MDLIFGASWEMSCGSTLGVWGESSSSLMGTKCCAQVGIVEHHEKPAATVFRKIQRRAEQPLGQRRIADILAPDVELMYAIGETPAAAEKIEDLRYRAPSL